MSKYHGRPGKTQVEIIEKLSAIANKQSIKYVDNTVNNPIYDECWFRITKFKPFLITIRMGKPIKVPTPSLKNSYKIMRVYTIKWCINGVIIDYKKVVSAVRMLTLLENYHIINID